MLDLTSASQIETWEACQRKGAWKYVARIEAPQNASAALGTEIDDTQLQPFLRDGRALDFSRPSGEIAQSILKYLPPPGSCGDGGIGAVQRHFEIPSPTWIDGKHCGLGFQGYVDLWLPSGEGMPDAAFDPLQLPNGRSLADGTFPPVVSDFKSTGDLKWAKTEAQLSTDIQAQSYAFWAMYTTRKPVVDLVWLYMRTKGARQSKRVHLRVHATEVAEQFASIDERARRVHALKKSTTDPLSLPPTPEHCDAYGGCPYRDRCNLGPGEIADAAAAKARRNRGEEETMSNATTGLLARLKAQREGGVVSTVPAGAGATATVITPPAAAEPTPVAAPATATPATVAAVGINPPEKDLPPAPPVGTAAPAAEAKRGPGRPPKQLTIPGSDANGGTRVRATWGKEKISPVSYNDFDIGPFEAEDTTRPGETVAQALERLNGELSAFAEAARAKKAASFAAALGARAAT